MSTETSSLALEKLTTDDDNNNKQTSEEDQMDYLFSLIDNLPKNAQARAFEKLKAKLFDEKDDEAKLRLMPEKDKKNTRKPNSKKKKSKGGKKREIKEEIHDIEIIDLIAKDSPEVKTESSQPSQPETECKKRQNKKRTIPLSGTTCGICQKKLTTGVGLRNHIMTHTGEKPFECSICEKAFRQRNQLVVHLRRHEGIKPYQCSVCSYSSTCKIDIVRHMPSHTGNKDHVCHLCAKSYTTDVRLKYHIRSAHDRQIREVCSYCGFSTHAREILRRHMLIKHTEKEKVECPICHEIVAQRSSFNVHMRRHTGEKPYQCTTCGKKFASSSGLNTHSKSHQEGQYPCPICGKKFKDSTHVKRHAVIHTGIKAHTCHMCPYACNVKGNLTKHVRTVHQIEKFTFRVAFPKGNNDLNDRAVSKGALIAQHIIKNLSIQTGKDISLEALKPPEISSEEHSSVDPDPYQDYDSSAVLSIMEENLEGDTEKNL